MTHISESHNCHPECRPQDRFHHHTCVVGHSNFHGKHDGQGHPMSHCVPEKYTHGPGHHFHPHDHGETNCCDGPVYNEHVPKEPCHVDPCHIEPKPCPDRPREVAVYHTDHDRHNHHHHHVRGHDNNHTNNMIIHSLVMHHLQDNIHLLQPNLSSLYHNINKLKKDMLDAMERAFELETGLNKSQLDILTNTNRIGAVESFADDNKQLINFLEVKVEGYALGLQDIKDNYKAADIRLENNYRSDIQEAQSSLKEYTNILTSSLTERITHAITEAKSDNDCLKSALEAKILVEETARGEDVEDVYVALNDLKVLYEGRINTLLSELNIQRDELTTLIDGRAIETIVKGAKVTTITLGDGEEFTFENADAYRTVNFDTDDDIGLVITLKNGDELTVTKAELTRLLLDNATDEFATKADLLELVGDDNLSDVLDTYKGTVNTALDAINKRIDSLTTMCQIPVGSFFETTKVYANSQAVAAELGYGTWALYGEGRSTVGYWAASNDFRATMGAVGGESEHVLTVNEMPSHNHAATSNSISTSSTSGSSPYVTLELANSDGTGDGNPSSKISETNTNTTGSKNFPVSNFSSAVNTNTSTMIANTGGNQAHNNLPPMVTVARWVRTGTGTNPTTTPPASGGDPEPEPGNPSNPTMQYPDYTGLGMSNEFNEVIAASPTLVASIRELLANGWTYDVIPNSKGGTSDSANKVIKIGDGRMEDKLDFFRVLAHESTHGLYTKTIRYDTKEHFIQDCLTNEGNSQVATVQMCQEAAAKLGYPIWAVNAKAEYQEAYAQILEIYKLYGTSDTADRLAGEIVGDNFVTGTTKVPYREYYGNFYDEHYTNA